MLRRSALYLPASNPRALAKARDLPADVLILDLEDAVAPEAKDAAREAARAALADPALRGGRREVVLRVNAPGTPAHAADLALAREARPDAVLVPKAEEPGILAALRASLAARGIALWAMVETPRGVLRAEALADALTPGTALVLGTQDLAAELRARAGPGREALLPHLARVLACARAAGLDALDGVWARLDDPAGLATEAAQGAALGFDGKTCIHPGQLAAVNAAFTPSPVEIDEARGIVAAAGGGAARLGGRMVEALHARAAARTLALAEAAAARDGG